MICDYCSGITGSHDITRKTVLYLFKNVMYKKGINTTRVKHFETISQNKEIEYKME